MQDRNSILVGGTVAAVVAAASLGALSVRAQDAPPKEGVSAPAPAAAAEDFGALVKSLGDADFAVREKAFGRLREAGAAARAALEEGAKSEDAQVRWSARRLLRSLDDGSAPPRKTLEFGGGTAVVEPQRDGDRSFLLFEDEAIRRRMQELRERMRSLEKEFEELPGRLPRLEISGNLLGPGTGGTSQRHVVVERDGERTEVKVDADGRVKATLTRVVDGKPKEETFEAESLEALEKEHPEVHGKVKDLVDGTMGGLRILVNDSDLRGSLQLPRLQFHDAMEPLRRSLRLVSPAKPVLGVTVSEAPDVLRTQCALDPDEGVVVEEVLEGTPAERLGLKRHDVLLAVNGIPVATAEDVRAAVGAVKEGGDLRLKVLRTGQRTELAGTR